MMDVILVVMMDETMADLLVVVWAVTKVAETVV